MSDCKSNHARLVRLEGEMHPSGKDYRCLDCGDVLEVEVKPAEIGVGFGEPEHECGKESAWLIERRDNGIEYACASSAGFDWTRDSLKAIRLCRREDANQIAEIFEFEDVHICEHQWIGPQAAQPTK